MVDLQARRKGSNPATDSREGFLEEVARMNRMARARRGSCGRGIPSVEAEK